MDQFGRIKKMFSDTFLTQVDETFPCVLLLWYRGNVTQVTQISYAFPWKFLVTLIFKLE